MHITGEKAKTIFSQEAGGHRHQRIPPTETRGRIQTSTVTVAILDLIEIGTTFRYNDVEIKTTKGSGPGGQARNKIESAVVITHKPTGLVVRSCTECSQYQNKKIALEILQSRLSQRAQDSSHHEQNSLRQQQIGSGERGDKIRTYREKDDRVVDHRTGLRGSLKHWQKGDLKLK